MWGRLGWTREKGRALGWAVAQVSLNGGRTWATDGGELLLGLVAGMSSPEGQELGAALLADEKNFIDHEKSCAFLVEDCEF